MSTNRKSRVYKSRAVWAATITTLIIMFNRKLGLDLQADEIAALVALIVALMGKWAWQNVRLS